MFLFNFIAQLPTSLPPEADYALPVVLGSLGVSALVDAFTGRIPNWILGVGAAVALVACQFVEGWSGVSMRFLCAAAVTAALWLANEFYYKNWGRDAFGMGDVKWTALAVFSFGVLAAVWSWVIGAWLALVWMGIRTLLQRLRSKAKASVNFVHFAPFLLAGLLTVLYGPPLRTIIALLKQA